MGADLDLFEFEVARVASGAKFVYLKNEAALLELALVNWALQKMSGHGYTPVSTPDAVHPRIAEACGFQPRDTNHTHLYHLENENLVLAGTSELLLAALHADKTYEVQQLPLRLVGFSHCFRAGEFMSTNARQKLARVDGKPRASTECISSARLKCLW